MSRLVRLDPAAWRDRDGEEFARLLDDRPPSLRLPYGLAWLLVGIRMAVRGSPTVIDGPIDPTQAREVQPA
jgi:hypothetical protein